MRWSGQSIYFYFSPFPKKDTKIDTFGLDRPDQIRLKTKAFLFPTVRVSKPHRWILKLFIQHTDAAQNANHTLGGNIVDDFAFIIEIVEVHNRSREMLTGGRHSHKLAFVSAA